MQESERTRPSWSTRKRDAAPRGVVRHPSGALAIRFVCGGGHIHKRRIGSVKSEAIRAYNDQRGRTLREPGWCPSVEALRERERVRQEQEREKARVLFRDYAIDYRAWRRKHRERSQKTDEGHFNVVIERFGDKRLDEITSLDIERFRDSLLARWKPATTNRYRDLLSALFKRGVRDGHVSVNPVRAVPKLKENNQRVTYITAEEEAAILDALPPHYRPHFTTSINTGLRWSEQMNLRWGDVDLLTRFITIPRSKHGESRRVPINSVVRSVLVDLGSCRKQPADPSEMVFSPRPKQSVQFFPKAVEQARATLKKADRDTSRLEGYVWHSNRHTFASRLAMAGVNLLTLKELGGWKTTAMVQRYAHLSPNHLHQAVERLVTPNTVEPAAELARN